MHRLLPFLFFAFFFSTAAPAAEKITADAVAGEYSQNNDGATTDTFKLVRLSSTTLYFSAYLYSSNGHSCELHGIADLEGDELVYRGALNDYMQQCVMRFGVSDDAITFHDVDGNCQVYSCGRHMSFEPTSFPRKSRAEVKYPETETQEYFAAQAEYADQKSGDKSRMQHDGSWYYDVGLLEYLKRQAEKGDLSAQVSLGSVYEAGSRAVPFDLKEAEKWYLGAAEKGDFVAQWHLGRLYVLDAPEKFLSWMMKSAKQGYSGAYHSLAEAYASGFGAEMDNVEYCFWLTLAHQADIARSANINMKETERMSELISTLTAEQYKEVKKRVAAWKPVSTSPHREPLKPKAP